MREKLGGSQINTLSASNRGWVGDRAGGWTVTVDAVGARTQDYRTRPFQTDRTSQDSFEISTTYPITSYGTRKLAS